MLALSVQEIRDLLWNTTSMVEPTGESRQRLIELGLFDSQKGYVTEQGTQIFLELQSCRIYEYEGRLWSWNSQERPNFRGLIEV